MKNTDSGCERRRYPRKETLFGVDIVRIGETNLLYKYDHEMGKNIGVGGVCVEATEVLSPSTTVRMKLMLEKSLSLIKAKGVVAWAKEYRRPETVVEGVRIGERLNFLMGIEFCDMAENDRRRIESFINEGEK